MQDEDVAGDIITKERLAKGDILATPDARGFIRQAQSVSSTILDYLLYAELLGADHHSSAWRYMGWKGAYDQRQGAISRRFDAVAGETGKSNLAAERYVKLVMRMPRLKLDLVNTACYQLASPAGRLHAREFHLSYKAAFDQLNETVDIISSLDLNDPV